MLSPAVCFRCGRKRFLKKCNECGTVFCLHCVATALRPDEKIPEVIETCMKCGSDRIIRLDGTFPQK